MSKTVANIEAPREVSFRFEERYVTDNTVAHALNLRGTDAAEAWDRFQIELKLHPYRYTPHSARRLVLLAVERAK